MSGYIKVFCCNSYGCHICKSVYTDFGPFSTVNQNHLCDFLYEITDYCCHLQTGNNTWKTDNYISNSFSLLPTNSVWLQIQLTSGSSTHLSLEILSTMYSSKPFTVFRWVYYLPKMVVLHRKNQ